MFSVEGISRAMRGFLGIEAGLQSYKVKKSNIHGEFGTKVW